MCMCRLDIFEQYTYFCILSSYFIHCYAIIILELLSNTKSFFIIWREHVYGKSNKIPDDTNPENWDKNGNLKTQRNRPIN